MARTDATLQEINKVLAEASSSFHRLRKSEPEHRSLLLLEIVKELVHSKQKILSKAEEETSLGEHRLSMEFNRTIGEIRKFAKLGEKLGKQGLSTEHEVGMNLLPLGPIVVIGACNFPLAITVVGTDTISAIMAGCPVVVKSHPDHEQTCELLADCVKKALMEAGLPPGCFSLIHGKSHSVAQTLVSHPLTSAVAFTGSLAGGKALFEICRNRHHPIPFYAEMGSLNPVFGLPCALKFNFRNIAKDFVLAINLFAGQMCTKPGALFVLKSSLKSDFLDILTEEIKKQKVLPMLSETIQQNYIQSCSELEKRILKLASFTGEGANVENPGIIQLFFMNGSEFLKCPEVRVEAFGPCSIVVCVEDKMEMVKIANSLEGNLTGSIHANREDEELLNQILPIIEKKVGRLLFNGFPPGVVPSAATQHGGPWPATTDSSFTSIGKQAYKRFMRPQKCLGINNRLSSVT